MAKQKAPLSVRLDPETDERLELVSEKIGVKKHTLARMSIEAAIDAIEQNNFEIVLPIRFDVKRIPMRAPERSSFPIRDEGMIVEERELPQKKKGKK